MQSTLFIWTFICMIQFHIVFGKFIKIFLNAFRALYQSIFYNKYKTKAAIYTQIKKEVTNCLQQKVARQSNFEWNMKVKGVPKPCD